MENNTIKDLLNVETEPIAAMMITDNSASQTRRKADDRFKVCVVGHTKAGKTALISRLLTDQFKEDHQ